MGLTRSAGPIRATRNSALVVMSALAVGPVLWLALASLKSNRELLTGSISLPEKFLFGTYRDVLVQTGILRYFLNSITISSVSVFIAICLASLAAYALARMEFWGKNQLFVVLALGLSFAPMARIIPLLGVMNALKLSNTRLGLILVYSSGISFSVVMMRSFFRQFPDELEQAAEIDGATKLQFLVRILLPLSMPAVSSLALFNFLHYWKEFLFAFMLLSRDSVYPISVGLRMIQNEFDTDYNIALASIVVSLMPMVILYIFFQRQFIQGVTAGAVKG